MKKEDLVEKLVMVLLIFAVAVLVHENVHEQVFAHYGVASRLEIRRKGIMTVPNMTQIANLTKDEVDSIFYYNLMTEIVGYPLMFITVLLGLILVKGEGRNDKAAVPLCQGPSHESVAAPCVADGA